MVSKTLITYETQERSMDTGFLRINLIEYGTHIYSQVNMSDGAAALIINDQKEILLIQSVRPAVGEISWEIPRGGIDAGETPAEAAARELMEETGFQVEAKHLLSLGYMNAESGILNARMYLFVHKTSQKRHSISYIPEDVEVKDIKWVNKWRVIEAMQNNEITDAATIAALGKAKLFGIL